MHIDFSDKPPSAREFLQQFVDEMVSIGNEGIDIGETTIAVSIRCFICDTPARSFIKGNFVYH